MAAQVFRLVTTLQMGDFEGDQARISNTSVLASAVQTNGYDCGCHALMNMRALATAAALLPEVHWSELQLPVGSDEQRDAAWRRQLVDELLSADLELPALVQ